MSTSTFQLTDALGTDFSLNYDSAVSTQLNFNLGGVVNSSIAFPGGSYTVLGVASPGTSGQLLQSNGAGNLPTWVNPTGGTVTSVTFTGDGTVLSSTPSAPVTTSGTLTASLNSQSANSVLAGPASGGAANPTFRSLVAADVPTLNQNTTGTASGITSGNGNVPACVVYAGTTTTLNAGTYTKVTLDTSLFNVGSFFDTSTSTFMPTKAGLYLISFGIQMVNFNPADNYGAVLYKNGSAYAFGSYCGPNNNLQGFHSAGSALVSMNGSTDYLELFGLNESSSSALAFNGLQYTNFHAVYVGPNS